MGRTARTTQVRPTFQLSATTACMQPFLLAATEECRGAKPNSVHFGRVRSPRSGFSSLPVHRSFLCCPTGSESDSSSSSSSSDEEGEQRRPAARRRVQKPEAGRQTEEQLRAQMAEDKRRIKEQEKAAKAARKEEKRLRKEEKQQRQQAEEAQATPMVAAKRGGDAALPADPRHHPSELPYPAAAGDAGMASDEEGDRRQLSWLLGQLLQ